MITPSAQVKRLIVRPGHRIILAPMTTQLLDHPDSSVKKLADPEARPKILLVDDDAFLREITAESLRESRYDVVEAGDAYEAQNLTEGRPEYQLLVTDFQMPGMNGMELASWFQAANPRATVLITTGSRGKVEDFAGGASPYSILEKPYTEAQLGRKIKEVLGGRNDRAHQPDSHSNAG